MSDPYKQKKESSKMAKKIAKVSVGRPVGKTSVDVETFVKTVMKHHRQGSTMTAVAEELGITPAAVSLRCKYLREHDVALPEFDRRGGNNSSQVIERAKAALAAARKGK